MRANAQAMASTSADVIICETDLCTRNIEAICEGQSAQHVDTQLRASTSAGLAEVTENVHESKHEEIRWLRPGCQDESASGTVGHTCDPLHMQENRRSSTVPFRCTAGLATWCSCFSLVLLAGAVLALQKPIGVDRVHPAQLGPSVQQASYYDLHGELSAAAYMDNAAQQQTAQPGRKQLTGKSDSSADTTGHVVSHAQPHFNSTWTGSPRDAPISTGSLSTEQTGHQEGANSLLQKAPVTTRPGNDAARDMSSSHRRSQKIQTFAPSQVESFSIGRKYVYSTGLLEERFREFPVGWEMWEIALWVARGLSSERKLTPVWVKRSRLGKKGCSLKGSFLGMVRESNENNDYSLDLLIWMRILYDADTGATGIWEGYWHHTSVLFEFLHSVVLGGTLVAVVVLVLFVVVGGMFNETAAHHCTTRCLKRCGWICARLTAFSVWCLPPSLQEFAQPHLDHPLLVGPFIYFSITLIAWISYLTLSWGFYACFSGVWAPLAYTWATVCCVVFTTYCIAMLLFFCYSSAAVVMIVGLVLLVVGFRVSDETGDSTLEAASGHGDLYEHHLDGEISSPESRSVGASVWDTGSAGLTQSLGSSGELTWQTSCAWSLSGQAVE